MKVGRIYFILGLILLLVGIGSIVFISSYDSGDTQIKEVTCYDNHNNKIFGESCIMAEDNLESHYFVLFITSFSCCFFGIILLMYSIILLEKLNVRRKI